jgi:hypothetical protein
MIAIQPATARLAEEAGRSSNSIEYNAAYRLGL